MNGARWTVSIPLLLAAMGCASSPDPKCHEEIQALREEVRDLKRRLDDQDGTSLGASLLARFPPTEWSQERLSAILKREIVDGKFRTAEEGEFIENFDAWKRALERRGEPGAK